MATIGVDLGGTKILTAEVRGGSAHHTEKTATPTEGSERSSARWCARCTTCTTSTTS